MSNVIFLPYVDNVKALCGPLEASLGVTYFSYLRFFKDGSMLWLTNSPEWGQDWFKDKLYKHPFVKDYVALKFGDCFTWKQFGDTPPAPIETGNKFGVSNGITFLNPLDNCLEMFWFGASHDNQNKVDLYKSNKDSFFRFIEFFKDKGYSLIKKSLDAPINFEDQEVFYDEKMKSAEKTILTLLYSDFLRFAYQSNGKTLFLSRQETICMSYCILQNSAKEIAEKMSLSERTVEDYIQNVKQKLSCYSKQDLLNKVVALDIVDIRTNPLEKYNVKKQELNITDDDFILNTSHKRIYVGDISDNVYITPKESEVLYYVCKGYGSKKIGDYIGFTPRTTEDYIHNIKLKFRTRKKSELTAFCVKHGIIGKVCRAFPETIQIGPDIRSISVV